jgi:catechol 2,3-dioxygenase-like lactoylglutathione lyase family enzyme
MERIGLNHLAFKCKSRALVDLVAKWIKGNGYSLLDEDRPPFAGGTGYYAVFFEDPDRIKLEVVTLGEA